MINWLMEQTVIMSVLLFVLLLTRKTMNLRLGAMNSYLLWGLVPISIIASAVTSLMSQHVSYKVYQYSVAIKSTIYGVIPKTQLASYATYLLVWSTGVIILFCFLLCGHLLQIRRLKVQTYDAFNYPLYVPKRLKVGLSKRLESPILFGWIKPVLVIPDDFCQKFTHQQQNMIIQHEVSHFKRLDHIWNVLAISVLVIFWFNPLVWFSYRYFRQQQELACDSAVLNNESLSNREQYALAMISASQQAERYFLTQINYSEKFHMKERITLVNKHKTNKILPTSLAMIAFASTISFAQLALASSAVKDSVSPLYRAAPNYPVTAAQNSIEGYVQLSFSIEKDGSTSNVEVIKSFPNDIFTEEAVKALKKWKYNKTTQQITDVTVQLDFVLSNDSDVAPTYNGTEIISVKKQA